MKKIYFFCFLILSLLVCSFAYSKDAKAATKVKTKVLYVKIDGKKETGEKYTTYSQVDYPVLTGNDKKIKKINKIIKKLAKKLAYVTPWYNDDAYPIKTKEIKKIPADSINDIYMERWIGIITNIKNTTLFFT